MTHMSLATHHTFKVIVMDLISGGCFLLFFLFHINSFPSALFNLIIAV